MNAVVNFCVVIGCRKQGDRDKGTRFFYLLAVITHQGEQTRLLSKRRRREWLASICRQDIKPENYAYTRVCSEHFASRQPSKLYESIHPVWTPSRNLGHSEKRAKVSGGARYSRAFERAVKRSHNDQDVHDDQEDHADVCGTESDVLHTSDVKGGKMLQGYCAVG